MIDVISNRRLVEKIRDLAKKIPGLWFLYGLFWKARMVVENNLSYPDMRQVQDFGIYSRPLLEEPVSQLCTANQMLSKTYKKWCSELNSPPRFARKQWEFVYILQALKKSGMLQHGKHGIGFGCGREPIVGLLAQYGCNVTASDLAEDEAKSQGWVDTMQHVSNIDELYKVSKRYISFSDFQSRVQYESVDMNHIPEKFYNSFDFTWSACSLEHLGSLRHGMDFIKNSLKCLKKGGVAVHTTEFNLSSNDETFESKGCSIYRASDIELLIEELQDEGYYVAPLNLHTGDGRVDNYIDAPPYGFSPHLKLQLGEFVATSIGLIIKKS